MRAVVLQGDRSVSVENVPDSGLTSKDSAVVRVERTAICGSDLHLYHGLVPDTFTDANDIEVIVEGRLGKDNVFRATEVLAKCGSRYEAELDKAKKA